MASAPARLAKFVKEDHRYVLLGTSAVAFVGMLLSSSPRPAMSFLANAFTVELVMYYLLVAWLVVSAVGLVLKLTHWKTYAQESPLAKPAAATALRVASYVVWACTVILFVDRAVMGFASAWAAAAAATSMPDDMLTQILYMFQQGKDTYLTGALTTIELAVFGTIIAFFLALLLAAVRILEIDRSDNDAIRFLKKVGVGFAKVYSTVVRGTPMMIQGLLIYFGGIGVLKAFGLSTGQIGAVWSTFVAGLVTISLNSTAYMMEVLRSGIGAVDSGQAEAARSLGLSQWQAMSKVVFPQGVKNSIPALSNELVINLKDSSVLSVIGVVDLMFATTTIAGKYYKQMEIYVVAMAVYLVLTMVASKLLGLLAKRLDAAEPGPVLGTSDVLSTKGTVSEEH